MSSKRKGIRREWELKKVLEERGFLVLRSSASRTGIDLIAGNGKDVYAIQVQESEYVSEEKLFDLKRYAKAFRLKPVFALKRKNGKRSAWFFVELKDMKKTGKMYKVEKFTMELE